MSVTWKKLWRDLARNKARTALAVLATAVGVFALGLTFGLSGVMRQSMTEAHKAVIPDNITFYGGPFDEETVEALLDEPDVAAVEGERAAGLRWRLEGEDEWQNAILVTRPDWENQTAYLIQLVQGDWPSGQYLGVERLASTHFDVPTGSTVIVATAEGEKPFPIAGVMREHMVFPPIWGGQASFYATPETVDWITGAEMDYTTLRVRLDSYTEESAIAAALRMQDELELMGYRVESFGITDPEVHWQQEMIDASFLIWGVLGVMSLGLSGFLIVNTMNALMAQQIWQVGVMKSVGATYSRLVRTFLMTALMYGVLAVLIAVPLGALGANGLAVFMLNLLNIDHAAFHLHAGTAILQIVIGLTVPLAAAIVPILGGVRISAHKAMSRHGIGHGFGISRFDRMMGRIRRLPRPLVVSLRNTFRRRARVAMTLITLVLSGVMFMMILTMDSSFDATISTMLGMFGDDVTLYLDRARDPDHLVDIAQDVPGVVAAEVWAYRAATTPLNGGQVQQVTLQGVPENSQMFNPRIADGGDVQAWGGRTVLVESVFAEDNGIEVGDEITLTILGSSSRWTMAGAVKWASNVTPDFFVPLDVLASEVEQSHRSHILRVTTEKRGIESEKAVGEALMGAYADHDINVTAYYTTTENRQQNENLFSTLTYTLMSMAALAAVVGCIGLMSTMSINVIERMREIGVMRAVGASSPSIAGMFVAEGLLLGVVSWMIAVPLSIPGSSLFNVVVGQTVLGFPLDFTYSIAGVVAWLAIALVLSALASLWPAVKATRVSVRESLAYE
jgi:putative ABC transport system permease protein